MNIKPILRGTAILLGLGLLVVGAAGAQVPASDWRVWIYDEGQGLLEALGPSGAAQTIMLPAAVTQAQTPDFTPRPVAISPDERYVIVQTTAGTMTIVDLQGGPSYQTMTPPIVGVSNYSSGGFSPAGDRFVTGYVAVNPNGGQTQGGITVVNVGANTVLANLPAAQFGPSWAVTATDVSWRQDGSIYFLPNCWQCEPAFEGPLYRWSPPNGASTQSGLFTSQFGDMLGLTGETVLAMQSDQFPSAPNEGFIPPANVIEYYPGNLPSISKTDGQPVFFDPQNLDLAYPKWVLDGQAFLLQKAGETTGTLVFRTEPQTTVSLPPGLSVLVGTPDGWLMQGPRDTGQVVLHFIRDTAGNYGALVAGQFVGPLDLVQSAPLGATAQGTFPVVAPQVSVQVVRPIATLQLAPTPTATPQISVQVIRPIGTLQVVTIPTATPQISVQVIRPVATLQVATTTCPGFMPSRLVVGQRGRVLPGLANNMRANPSASSQLVGQMAGGAEFTVIAGPQCDPAGIAWWQVNYLGTVGWTGEGQGQDYWVEPIGP